MYDCYGIYAIETNEDTDQMHHSMPEHILLHNFQFEINTISYYPEQWNQINRINIFITI